MNSLTVVFFASLAVLASAKPGILGAGLLGAGLARVVPAGPTTLIGASGVVGPNGAAGPAGVVTGNGAIGPLGIPNAIGHGVVLGGLGAPLGAVGIGAARLGIPAIGAAGLGVPAVGVRVGLGALDDGQWRGEGLLESQDLTGQAARLVSGHALGLRAW